MVWHHGLSCSERAGRVGTGRTHVGSISSAPTGQILKTKTNYARVLGWSGKQQQALSLCLELIIELTGRLTKQQIFALVDVFDIAGRMCEQLGRPGDAVQHLERAKATRERLIPRNLSHPDAHYMATLDHLADSYRLSGRLHQALDTYTTCTVASALRERAGGDHAAQVWRWQDADKRTTQDWLSAVEARVAQLKAEVWSSAVGFVAFSFVCAFSFVWRRRVG